MSSGHTPPKKPGNPLACIGVMLLEARFSCSTFRRTSSTGVPKGKQNLGDGCDVLPNEVCVPSLSAISHFSGFGGRPEIRDFGSQGGPGGLGNPSKRWEAKPPTFFKGFQSTRGHPDPQFRRLPSGHKNPMSSICPIEIGTTARPKCSEHVPALWLAK